MPWDKCAPGLLPCLFLTVGCSDYAGNTPMQTAPADVREGRRSRRADQQIVVEGNTAFAPELYAKLRQRPGNLCLSPSSISVALASFISADEQGTEAAAATATVMTESPAGRWPVFRADHPFSLGIRHQAMGSILFLGRLAKP